MLNSLLSQQYYLKPLPVQESVNQSTFLTYAKTCYEYEDPKPLFCEPEDDLAKAMSPQLFNSVVSSATTISQSATVSTSTY